MTLTMKGVDEVVERYRRQLDGRGLRSHLRLLVPLFSAKDPKCRPEGIDTPEGQAIRAKLEYELEALDNYYYYPDRLRRKSK